MTWTTNPYATLSQVHSALDLQSTSDDTWINEELTEAQAAVDDFLGFSFQTDGTTSTPAVRVYDGNDMEELMIDRCVSITQVIETLWTIVQGTNGNFIQKNSTQRDISVDVVLGPNN